SVSSVCLENRRKRNREIAFAANILDLMSFHFPLTRYYVQLTCNRFENFPEARFGTTMRAAASIIYGRSRTIRQWPQQNWANGLWARPWVSATSRSPISISGPRRERPIADYLRERTIDRPTHEL